MRARAGSTRPAKPRTPPHRAATLALGTALLLALATTGATASAALASPTAYAAAARLPAAAPAAAASAASGHVTILVLDMSGSMGQPGQGGNDPDGLRCSAAHAYIDLSGAGQWVGIVGLAHPGGAPGSATTAQDYAPPAEMSTDSARAAMRKALDTHSNNCLGDGTTPMADALARADHMLLAATQGGQRSGSVILLTDGLPDPDATGQLAAIHSLMGDFESHDWPIDTIALGGADRGFLRGVSDSTGGTAYDVAHGPVPGVSPLNLEPFFVDIFRVNQGRTLLHAVAPTAIAGSTQRQFHVGRFIAHMDVLVVRDSANVAVQLYAPGSYPNAPEQPGQARIVENDPHYAIFSIDNPIRGDWVLAYSGQGQVLTDALLQSSLALQLVSPRANQHLPIGLALPLDAALRDGQDQVLAEPVTVTASIGPANGSNGSSPTAREVTLRDPGGASPTGNYTGSVTLASGSPHGTYHIALQAQLNDAQVSLVVPIVIEAFPVPTLLAPSDGKPQPAGLALDAVPGAPLTIAFGLTVDGTLQTEPNVTASLLHNGQRVPLSAYAGSWQGTYIPAGGAQHLTVQLAGTYHGTDLAPWPYTLPLTITLRPSLALVGLDARRPYPAHRSVNVSLAYFRQAGIPDPAAAGHITALLLPPDGIGVPLPLQPRLDARGQPEAGSFATTIPFGAPGTYTVRAIFDDGVPGDHSEQIYILRVIDFPTAVPATTTPGQQLTSWGPLGGLYGLPIVRWLAPLPLAGKPNVPTAVLSGTVRLAGQPYTGGTVSAVAFPVGSSHALAAQVARSGAQYTVRFQPPTPGAYQVVVTWSGAFAGLAADQEPTSVLVQAAIVAPDLLGWGRAWAITAVYVLLLLALLQFGRFSLTPAPAGAFQTADRPDDLFYLAQSHTPLWRRFLWRNRVRTADLGMPPGAEVRFRYARGPVILGERGETATGVLVGGAPLPGSAPVPLESGAAVTFRQGALDLDELDDLDDLDGARAARRSRRPARGDDEGLASSYVYVSAAELRERAEHDDPFAAAALAADEPDDPYDTGTHRPRSPLEHVGALLALLRPVRRPTEDDEFGDLFDDLDAKPARGRSRRADPLDDGDSGASTRRSRAGRATRYAEDDLDPYAPSRASARRRGGKARAADDFDQLYDERPSRGRTRARGGDLDDLDDLFSARPRRGRRSADDLY